jgi:uroporphyrin-III C-methyltransferase
MKKEVTQHFGQVILHDLPDEPCPAMDGSCTLVSAAPGDTDWLPMAAAKAVREATVLLVDDLISDAVVALAPPPCRVVRVGKRDGGQPMPQAFVEKLILHAVHEGHQVVHLKGDSPFDFACVGGEFENLKAAGIASQIQLL